MRRDVVVGGKIVVRHGLRGDKNRRAGLEERKKGTREKEERKKATGRV